jgi:DnaK suppressor protein
MTALFEVSRQDGRAAHEAFSAVDTESVRGQLLAGIGDWSARFAQDAAMLAVLTTNPSEDPTSINRAMAALHMYSAIEAIEEIQDALVRISDGRYGTCQSCNGPIPFERLAVKPQTRFCDVCSTAVDPPERSRRSRVRGERAVLPSRALTVERLAADRRDLTESRHRHPSSIRYANSPYDPASDEHSPGCSRKPERDAAAS